MAKGNRLIDYRNEEEERARAAKKAQQEEMLNQKRIQQLDFRTRALASGVPESVLPTTTQIANNVSDADWNNTVQRSFRYAPHLSQHPAAPSVEGAAINGAAPTRVAPAQRDGIFPMGMSLSEKTAVLRSMRDPRAASVTRGAQRTSYIMPQMDKSGQAATEAKYGEGVPAVVKPGLGDVGQRQPFIAGANGKNVAADYVAGGKFSSATAPDPSLDPNYITSLKTPGYKPPMQGPPFMAFAPEPEGSTGYKVGQTIAGIPEQARTLGSQAVGAFAAPFKGIVRGAKDFYAGLTGAPVPTAPSRPPLAGTEAAPSIPIWKQAFNAFTAPLGGGKSTAAGVSRSQAAGFDSGNGGPPITPTTPTAPEEMYSSITKDIFKKKPKFAGAY